MKSISPPYSILSIIWGSGNTCLWYRRVIPKHTHWRFLTVFHTKYTIIFFKSALVSNSHHVVSDMGSKNRNLQSKSFGKYTPSNLMRCSLDLGCRGLNRFSTFAWWHYQFIDWLHLELLFKYHLWMDWPFIICPNLLHFRGNVTNSDGINKWDWYFLLQTMSVIIRFCKIGKE